VATFCLLPDAFVEDFDRWPLDGVRGGFLALPAALFFLGVSVFWLLFERLVSTIANKKCEEHNVEAAKQLVMLHIKTTSTIGRRRHLNDVDHTNPFVAFTCHAMGSLT